MFQAKNFEEGQLATHLVPEVDVDAIGDADDTPADAALLPGPHGAEKVPEQVCQLSPG